MAEISRISTSTPWEPVFGYSRAVRAGNLVVVSGTTATDRSGSLIGINQMYVQAKQAIANIASALERAGTSLANVVRTRIFVTDISRFEEVARAHREAFGEAPPAATLVEVRRLVSPDMLIEIEADAIVPELASSNPATSSDSSSAARPAAKIKPKKSSRKITSPAKSVKSRKTAPRKRK